MTPRTSLQLILLLGLVITPGCMNLSKTIQELPGYEFGELNYARTGNITSTTIHAENAKIENDVLSIESVNVVHSNPLFGINANVKGLKRPARK
jgi:hypothetical protein